MAKHRAVFLVGFMGAGKTSVGRELATRLGWPFVDLDDRIEAREKRTVAEIFRDSGEEAFRKAEAEALGELLGGLDPARPVVAALGGGAIVQTENAKSLQESGEPIIFLDADFEELRRRCAPQGATRPLFTDEQRFRGLYHTRRPYYEQHMRLDTTHNTVAQVAAQIIERLQLGR